MDKEMQDKEKMNAAYYDTIEYLKGMNESTNAAKTSVKYSNCEGGIDIEISVRKHGKFAYDEFTPEKLKVIKELAVEKLKSEKSEILQGIINVCNDKLEEYDNSNKE